jgi:hypothetical protein
MMAAGFVLLNFVEAIPPKLILMWVLAAAGAALKSLGWPGLFSVLLAYGYAARIPVALVMFLASRGHRKTHYTASNYLLFGFFPQWVGWVAFTVIIGSLSGSVVTALAHRGKVSVQGVS